MNHLKSKALVALFAAPIVFLLFAYLPQVAIFYTVANCIVIFASLGIYLLISKEFYDDTISRTHHNKRSPFDTLIAIADNRDKNSDYLNAIIIYPIVIGLALLFPESKAFFGEFTNEALIAWISAHGITRVLSTISIKAVTTKIETFVSDVDEDTKEFIEEDTKE